ncbi:hypothetical protein [Rhodopila sp.]|uniref:hypothetical protein n=1 Tax=Rhodopila sp. TaxID=2480087 RepID=UPI003D147D9A
MKTSAIPALSLMLLAGCSQPPLLSLADRVCDTAPRLMPGNEVSLGRGGSSTVIMDAASPCVETPAGRASYIVFALPADNSPYQITVRSHPRGGALISPEATIYGADDRPRREIGGFRGAAGTLVASTTGEPGDRYVVVTSTPDTIGVPRNVPTAGNPPPIRLAATIVVPIIMPASPAGPTTDIISAILAHSGAITVSANPFITLP